MKKVVIFGNSGSGKSTLAKKLATKYSLAHLELDSLAWLPSVPPVRKPLEESRSEIQSFMNSNESWVIEGCYTDLLGFSLEDSTEIVFTNLPTDACIENAKNRPWEPHKYVSKEAQDQNLGMLVDWITDYDKREDTFSRKSHVELYEGYSKGKKIQSQNEY